MRTSDFYTHWSVFAAAVLRAKLANHPTQMPLFLLVTGAVLGESAMHALVSDHTAALDSLGHTWGVADLNTLAQAPLDSAEGLLFLRILGQHADAQQVDSLQSHLRTVRSIFTEIRDEIEDEVDHKAAVNSFFETVAVTQGLQSG